MNTAAVNGAAMNAVPAGAAAAPPTEILAGRFAPSAPPALAGRWSPPAGAGKWSPGGA
jgi:hypothetical protein